MNFLLPVALQNAEEKKFDPILPKALRRLP
jgi:hypothetical protein